MPQLLRRPGGRHLHGHAPLAQPVGQVAAPGPGEERGGRAAVGGVELVDAEREVGRELLRPRRGRCRPPGAAGTVRRAGRRHPGRTTHTGPADRLAHRGADGLDRSRAAACASGRRCRTSRRRCPTRRWSPARGPCPARSSTNSCSAVGVDLVARPLVEPGVATTGAGRSGFGATTTPSPARSSSSPRSVGVEVGVVLEEHVAPLEDAHLHRPGDRLVDHARPPAGPAGGAPTSAGRTCTRCPPRCRRRARGRPDRGPRG